MIAASATETAPAVPTGAEGPADEPPGRQPLVIDTSVAVKWYIPEDFSAEARLYRANGLDRHAPDFLPLEASHALLKRVRSTDPDRAIGFEEARAIADALRASAPIQYHPLLPTHDLAFVLAHQIGASVYDGLFLALALLIDGQVVTADRKFHDKVVASPHAARIRWVEAPP